MNPQEREEMDYQMGSASELQNAYTMSCLDRRPDDKGKIAELVAAGRFCVVAWNVEFCRHTDAVLPGTHRSLIADFATREEAEACRRAKYEEWGDDGDGECGIDIQGPPPPAPPVPQTNESEIPF